MNEEIKEILDITLDYLEGIDETRNTKILTTNETNILLDYITNLQKENERLKHQLNQEKPNYLQIWQLEDRIDKAVEYIKENCSYEEDTKYCYDDLCSSDVNNLLNILQNGSEEK